MSSVICAFFLIVKITKIMYWLFLASQLLNLSWFEQETAGQVKKLVQDLSKNPNYLWFIPRRRNNQLNTNCAQSCLILIMWLCPGVRWFSCTTFPTYVSAKALRVKNIQCGAASILRGCARIWSGSSKISNPCQLQNTRGRGCSQMVGLRWCLSCAFLVEVMEKISMTNF